MTPGWIPLFAVLWVCTQCGSFTFSYAFDQAILKDCLSFAYIHQSVPLYIDDLLWSGDTPCVARAYTESIIVSRRISASF